MTALNVQGIIHLSHVELPVKRFVRTCSETFCVKEDVIQGVVHSVEGDTAVVCWETGKTGMHRVNDLKLVRQ